MQTVMTYHREIVEGIYQVRLPLPFALDHINTYLLRDDLGWTIVDTGLNVSKAREAWQVTFAALDIDPRDVRQIVLTHVHPDHYGLAGWLQEFCRSEKGAPPIYLSEVEAGFARRVWQGEEFVPKMFPYLKQCGLTPNLIEPVADSVSSVRQRTAPHPPVLETIDAGATISMGNREFKMIHAPGHADGQLIFYEETDGILICGDHMLNQITPHISKWPDVSPNPLKLYLTSLGELIELDVRLALPGHKTLIEDWGGRLDEMLIHHNKRLTNTVEFSRGGATVAQVSSKIFGDDLNVHNMRFAIAETLSHLDYLVEAGELTRDGDEVWIYRP